MQPALPIAKEEMASASSESEQSEEASDGDGSKARLGGYFQRSVQKNVSHKNVTAPPKSRTAPKLLSQAKSENPCLASGQQIKPTLGAQAKPKAMAKMSTGPPKAASVSTAFGQTMPDATLRLDGRSQRTVITASALIKEMETKVGGMTFDEEHPGLALTGNARVDVRRGGVYGWRCGS